MVFVLSLTLQEKQVPAPTSVDVNGGDNAFPEPLKSIKNRRYAITVKPRMV